MFTNEGLFFANMKAVLFGGSFTGTGFGTKAPGFRFPDCRLMLAKCLAAVITDTTDRLGALMVSDIHALPRAVNASVTRNIRKCLTADLADMSDAWLAPFSTRTDMSALARATQFVRAVLADSGDKGFVADGANQGSRRHCRTSDSVHREKNQGALLGKNACQQVMTLLKPYTKYIMKHRISQGGFYACC